MFEPTWAAIIPGVYEGGFGWIAYNYLKKLIGPKRSKVENAITPYAVVEMGGASTQVTALANPSKVNTIPDANKYAFTCDGENYVLYTHSYLGFGGEQAREKVSKSLEVKDDVIKDPCLNVGYTRSRDTQRKDVFDGSAEAIAVEGSSSKTSCTKAVKDEVINTVKQKNCVHLIGGQYTMDCQFQPTWVDETENFLVFENFFWAASGANVMKASHTDEDTKAISSFPLITTPKEYKDASQEVCGKTWDEINQEYPRDGQGKENNNKWCFMLSYTAAFLIDGLKLSWAKQITVQRLIGDSEIEWALGAVYKELEDLFGKNIGNLREQPTISKPLLPLEDATAVKEEIEKEEEEEEEKEDKVALEVEEANALTEETPESERKKKKKERYEKWKTEKDAAQSNMETALKRMESKRAKESTPE